MENVSDGHPSEESVTGENDEDVAMANFPPVEGSVNEEPPAAQPLESDDKGKDETEEPNAPINVNGENSTEENKSDDQDSSDCDALVIDESAHTKKTKREVKSKSPRKTSDDVEVAHTNPYFQESLFELSQLHHNNHATANEDDSSNAEIKTNVCKAHRRQQDRKKKPGNHQLREYAQYLGLQPTVQFKCSKCKQAGFSSLATLNEHHVQCNAQAPAASEGTNCTNSAPSTNFRVTRKVYLCSACGTYYENWNLFLHMREVHKRFICLYCLGMFSQPEKLSQHLMVKHNCVPGYRNTLDDFFELYKEPCFLMCCDCERVFSEQENFFNHVCVSVPKNNKCTNNHKHSNKQVKQVKGHVEHITGDAANSNGQTQNVQAVESEVDADSVDMEQDSTENLKTTVEHNLQEESAQVMETKDSEERKDSHELSDTDQPGTATESDKADIKLDELDLDQNSSIESKFELSDVNINEDSVDNAIENPVVSEDSNDKLLIEEDTRKVPKVTLKLPKSSVFAEPPAEEMEQKETMDVEQSMTTQNFSENVPNENKESLQLAGETPLQTAGPDIPIVELELEQPLDKFDIKELLRKCLRETVPVCIYCNHARKIAVNGKYLGTHAIAEHRFSAIVNSITAEELIPESFNNRIKESFPELEKIYFNLDDNANEEGVTFSHIFECFQCRFSTTVHKELYLHNRKSHAKTILLCIMCKSNFYSYSELICHLCPGYYLPGSEIHFRCCLCVSDELPSAFRLMVHLRKRHNVCDVCLEMCHNQSRLSNHVWKHKLHHFCYRCGIAYRNKPDITKHLFWKHGTESVLCKKCLQKKWPHVYHFCIPPSSFTCEECNLSFARAVSLKVHKRLHSDEKPHQCTIDGCTERFISKKLLLKHEFKHREPPEQESLVVETIKDVLEDNKAAETDNLPGDGENDEKVNEEKPLEKPKPKVDVYDLPALNLSESDTSDSETEPEKPKMSEIQMPSFENDIQPPVETATKTDEETSKELEPQEKPAPVIENIWDDFKNYQANKEKLDNPLSDQPESPEEEKENLAEIVMKDHDYYVDEPSTFDTINEIPPEGVETAHSIDHDYFSPTHVSIGSPQKIEDLGSQSPKKVTSPKKRTNSSSDSSSDSDSSSCSCGSNCSCSSSSSSSSSDSSESDSSTSEGRRRQQLRREKKKERVTKSKEAEAETAEKDKQNVPAAISEIPILESDLETLESETDEDFYDEQPQKLASKALAEKRSQLLAEIGPVVNGTLLENSRPSTPSLPEEVKPKKKSKSKKRKKKRSSKSENTIRSRNIPVANYEYVQSPTVAPLTLTIPRDSPVALAESAPLYGNADQPMRNSTETDLNLRASKRRRVPNKFYGYSSEEDQDKQHQPKWRKMEHQPPAQQVAPAPLLVPPITIKTVPQQPQPTVEPISIRTTSQPGELRVHPARMPPPHLPLPHDSDSNDSCEEFSQVALSQKPNQPALYCYCRCPYDEVSEMIGCDSSDCAIEWFHFECVGIMVPPKGQWFCPDCRKRKQQRKELLQQT